VEFRRRFSEILEGKELNEALDDFQRELEEYLTRMINDKHASLMIPRVTVDVAHAEFGMAAASAAGNLDRL
jgi:hypothetical protein